MVDWAQRQVYAKRLTSSSAGPSHTAYYAFSSPVLADTPPSFPLGDGIDLERSAHHQAAVDALKGNGSYAGGERPPCRYMSYAYKDYDEEIVYMAVLFDRRLFEPGIHEDGEWVPFEQVSRCFEASSNPIESDLIAALRSRQTFDPKPILARPNRPSGHRLYPKQESLSPAMLAALNPLFSIPGFGPECQSFVRRTVTLQLPFGPNSGKLSLQAKNSLLDSGATGANYLSRKFYEENKAMLAPFSRDANLAVDLAGTGKKAEIKTVVSMQASILDTQGQPHFAMLDFHVIDTSIPIVIGLPALAGPFLELWVTIWSDALRRRFGTLRANKMLMGGDADHTPASPTTFTQLLYATTGNDEEIKPAGRNEPIPVSSWATGQAGHPWRDGLGQEHAEEEDTVGMPVNFEHFLSFAEEKREESLKKYREGYEKQVRPDLAAAQLVDPDTGLPATFETLLLEPDGLGERAYVPHNWDGIKLQDKDGNPAPPIELKTIEGHVFRTTKPGHRYVNPKLMPSLKKETDRLCEYMYEPSTSPYCSPLVVASKATEPFIRCCGDYVEYNKGIETIHYPIPNVLNELNKIKGFKVYADMDMATAFHQIPIGPLTSRLLSVQTPFGQFQPRFMPEGVSPASGHLQRVVSEIFHDFSDWMVVIFDNLLVLAHDHQDLYNKTKKVLQRCNDRNVFLKFSKSHFGVTSCEFFGYVVDQHGFQMSEKRVQSIADIPFPSNEKQMRSFLGCALFFKGNVPRYADYTTQLNDMVHKDFNWRQPSQWKVDYRGLFETFKGRIKESVKVYFPDYSLEWVLRTDASEFGVGGVLFQVFKGTDGAESFQPIAFCSKKFSDPATRWATIEQETFGIVYCVQQLSYLLRGKTFEVQTDHRNILWLENSVVPKLVRWRLFLASYVFTLRHIPGKLNIEADFLSRVFALFALCPTPIVQTLDTHSELADHTYSEFLRDLEQVEPLLAPIGQPLTPAPFPTGIAPPESVVRLILSEGPRVLFVNPVVPAPKQHKSGVQLPGGSAERETLPEAALRALREETGFELAPDKLFELPALTRAEDLDDLGDHTTYFYGASAANLVYHADPSPENPRISHLWLTVPQVQQLPLKEICGGSLSSGLMPLDEIQARLEQGPDAVMMTPQQMLSKVHGGRAGHNGARRTMVLLNNTYPGHRVSQQLVQEYVNTCWTCQKVHTPRGIAIEPVVRHIKPPGIRSAVGADTLTISPPDKAGNRYVIVVVNLFTKLCELYPVANKEALTLARVLFKHMVTFGKVDELHSDPGSDFTSQVVEHLNRWFGIHHVVALVDRHTSSGSEGTNNGVLRHAKAIIYDERLLNVWSEAECLSFVQYVLNDSVNAETGFKPFEMHHGTAAATYHMVPDGLSPHDKAHEFVRLLDENLKRVLEVSKDYQDALIKERLAANPAVPNQYQAGDLVMQRTEKMQRPYKLSPTNPGPYEVVSHRKNDIKVRHLHRVKDETLQAEKCFPFWGTRADAERAAAIDGDQHVVQQVLSHRGDTEKRTTCTFEVLFQDGEIVKELPWSEDLSTNAQYRLYIAAHPICYPLAFSVAELSDEKRRLRALNVSVDVGQRCYVDIRGYGADWYNALGLPNSDTTTYVVEYVFRRDKGAKNLKKIDATCRLYKSATKVDEYWITCYGQWPVVQQGHVLVDAAFLAVHPQARA